MTTAGQEAERGLSLLGTLPNDELRWRLAAIGAAAARHRGDTAAAAVLSTSARDALARLRTAWKTDVDPYERRPDLAALVKKEQP